MHLKPAAAAIGLAIKFPILLAHLQILLQLRKYEFRCFDSRHLPSLKFWTALQSQIETADRPTSVTWHSGQDKSKDVNRKLLLGATKKNLGSIFVFSTGSVDRATCCHHLARSDMLHSTSLWVGLF